MHRLLPHQEGRPAPFFYDYRINAKLKLCDASKDSLVSVLTFLVETIDGLRRMDDDEIMVDEPLRVITEAIRSMEGNAELCRA